MHAVRVRDYPSWRIEARALLRRGIPPEEVSWDHAHAASLTFPARQHDPSSEIRIPKTLLELLDACACHRDPHRWALMYRVAWRAARNGDRSLLSDPADADVCRLRAMEKAVHREVHKLHAFVRFRETADDTGSQFVAWFEPEHDVLRRAAPFFRDRFASMRWMIVTPALAAGWDGSALRFMEGPHARPELDDGLEALWRTYYASIFNPARLNERMMAKEMPRRYWRNLPEARDIAQLSRAAERRVEVMKRTTSEIPHWATHFVARAPTPETHLDACRRCPLWERATQAVPGGGPDDASVMLVGEQPGDEEDLRGAPFVGPAGKVLDSALEQVGLPRESVFITNAVKHFKWEPQGKRRLHKTPAQQEIQACGHWLNEEIRRVAPRVIVALGATALLALTGERRPIARSRGLVLRHASGAKLIATYHPSAILRTRDDTQALFDALCDDLRQAQSEGGLIVGR